MLPILAICLPFGMGLPKLCLFSIIPAPKDLIGVGLSNCLLGEYAVGDETNNACPGPTGDPADVTRGFELLAKPEPLGVLGVATPPTGDGCGEDL